MAQQQPAATARAGSGVGGARAAAADVRRKAAAGALEAVPARGAGAGGPRGSRAPFPTRASPSAGNGFAAAVRTASPARAPLVLAPGGVAAVGGGGAVSPGANGVNGIGIGIGIGGGNGGGAVANGAVNGAAAGRAPANGKSWLAAAVAPPKNSIRDGHVLHRSFQFSYVRRSSDKNKVEDYEQQIKSIASVATVEEFWQVYVHLHRVSKLAPLTDYFLFQEGVLPMWEDVANRRGGRLCLRISKTVSPRAFEDLCLALIGEQFDTDDICGIACSVRVVDNNLSIWLRYASDRDLVSRVEAVARRALDLPGKSVLRDWTFKPHLTEQSGHS